jgi:paraquat-inducible protein B
MSEGESGGTPRRATSLPEAVVQQKTGFSIVWVIPIVAALVGAFLVYKALSEQGPEITITFETADGLEAGKTKIKYKDVEVGLVESIELDPELRYVVVTAEMVPGAESYLTEDTRFWVVRARVSAGQVSGIGTVFSGAYIGIDPSTEGAPQTDFVGLEDPPVVTSDESGTTFELEATELGSTDVGSPVYYRWIKVGQVAGYELSEDGQHVSMKVFVEKPHDARVNTNTRFWNASGLDVSVTADGVSIDTPSVVSMLIGGVAFDTPESLGPGGEVPEGFVFPLYDNHKDTTRPRYTLKQRYLLYFNESVGGLDAGAPVEFRGIRIGEVQDVRLIFDEETGEPRIPVVIELEPERIGLTVPIDPKGPRFIDRLVAQGLRARLKSANLLTGQLLVDLDFVPDAPPAEVMAGERYPVLPTVPGSFDAIATSVARIVDKVEQMPIDDIGNNLDRLIVELKQTVGELGKLSSSINDEVAPSLVETLESANTLLGPTTQREFERLMLDLARTARSFRLLADRLEQHPEELLRGRE